MNREQSALWLRIESFEIDDPAASFPFSARLAQENGWTREFALRVVEEYKRFVFLMMFAGHEVTPSNEVDQAWHLHLVYTHSYWDELCGQVLGRPLHHGPTKGGCAEGDRFEDQYLKTLESYERYFGSAPPNDIWPPCKARFAKDERFVRVNAKRHWIVNKRTLSGAAVSVAAACIALLIVGAADRVERQDHFAEFDSLTTAVVLVGGLILIVSILSYLFGKNDNRHGGSSGCGTGFFGCSGDVGHSDVSSGCGASGCGASGCGASGCGGSGCGGGGCGGGGCGGGGD